MYIFQVAQVYSKLPILNHTLFNQNVCNINYMLGTNVMSEVNDK